MNAYRNYTNNVSAMKKNLEKLSSGYKINRAGDDAAGLAISEKMRAQITGLETAQKNAKDGISLIQTAEGALTEVHDMLNRMVELATQSANGTYDNTTDRDQLQKEMNNLRTEINRISKAANFNGIKLLDGSLGEGDDLSADGVKTIDAATVEGIDIQKTGPGGSYGEYSFTIDKTFGNGDKFKISFGTGDPTNNQVPATLDTVGGAGGATGTLELSYDITEATANSFGGLTTEEQAASVAKTLSQNADIAANFEVSVNGSTVTLKNLNEGNKELTVTNVATSTPATNNQATLGTATNTDAVAGTGAIATFANLFDPSNAAGREFEDGGKVEISFNDLNGHTWKATVNVERGTTDKETHDNLVAALTAGGDNTIYFENIDGTVADESKIAFKDLFTASSENSDKDFKLTGTAGARNIGATAFTLKVFDKDGAQIGTDSTVTATAGTGGTKQIYKDWILDTTADGDYSVGDKINLTGTLSDGRTFKVTLEAGKDFEIGDSHSETNDNIIYALAGSRGSGVEVQIMDDTDPTVVAETVNSKDIFNEDGVAAGAGTKEFMIKNNAGNIEITSNVQSDANAGSMTAVEIIAADNGSIANPNLLTGTQQTGAATTITVEDGKVAEGSVVTVEGKSFVLTENDAPADADPNNIYVKVADLTNGADVAKALGDAITANVPDADQNGTADYTVSVNGNTITLTTEAVGEGAEPVDATGRGAGSQTALEFTLDPKTVTNGSRVTIEGREYEFVAKDSRATKNDDGTNKYNVVVVDNLNVKEGDGAVTSKQLGDALKAAVEKNIASESNPDGDKISIDVDDNGLVTLKGTDFGQHNPDDVRFTYNTPKDVEFYSKGGLKLQIGDTAESFNQLNVVIKAVNTKAMNIDDISIADQDSAGEAIDVIKAAINYVSDVRGTLGATQNRLDHTINNLSVMTENIQDAESTIRDTDVASEMMKYTKNNILIQSAQAMLAQANQVPQGVLQLLQ